MHKNFVVCNIFSHYTWITFMISRFYSLESPIIRLLFPNILLGSIKFFMARMEPSPTSPTVFFSHRFRSLPTKTIHTHS